ncbi:MAG: cache domain-containing protein [Candidatus Riflebacteria bacterium]|nr:cache domain-containing protein [Candidatus Riflebacteria bacterium]
MKKNDPIRIIYLLCGLIIVLILYLSWESVFREREERISAAGAELRAYVNLASDDTARALFSVRDTLRLISRMPAMRDYSYSGVLFPALLKIQTEFAAKLDLLTEKAIVFEREILEQTDECAYYAEVLEAAIRRLKMMFREYSGIFVFDYSAKAFVNSVSDSSTDSTKSSTIASISAISMGSATTLSTGSTSVSSGASTVISTGVKTALKQVSGTDTLTVSAADALSVSDSTVFSDEPPSDEKLSSGQSFDDAAADEEEKILPNLERTSIPLKLFSEKIHSFFQRVFSGLETSAVLVDSAFCLGSALPKDSSLAKSILRASMSDLDLIKSISIQTFFGSDIISVSEISRSPFFLSGWIRKASTGAMPFYPGPVSFDEGLGKPVWQAAVPMRDLERNTFALLSAVVDLGFLHEISCKAMVSSSSQLIFVDDQGIVIGHSKLSKIALQLNISHSNTAVASVVSGKDGVEEVNMGGGRYLAAYRNLKNYDGSSLPGWGIIFLKPLSEVMSPVWLSAINTIFVAFITIYILLYLAGIIISGLEEDEETES